MVTKCIKFVIIGTSDYQIYFDGNYSMEKGMQKKKSDKNCVKLMNNL